MDVTITIDDKLAHALLAKLGEKDMATVVQMAVNGWANELGVLEPLMQQESVVSSDARVSPEVAKAASDEFAKAARLAGIK